MHVNIQLEKPDINEIHRTSTCAWEDSHGIKMDVREIGCVGVYLIHCSQWRVQQRVF